MANVISLDQKLKISQKKKTALVRNRKITAVQKVFQCTHCAFKCEKCGAQTSTENQKQNHANHKTHIPYRFCNGCYEEYLDYIDRLKGKRDQDCYWHNEEWLRAWRSWIDYQSSIDLYLKSKEFVQLVDELKQTRSDP